MGKRGPRLSKTDRAIVRERIVRMHLDEIPGYEIAERVGVTPAYVSYVLKVLRRALDIQAIQGLDAVRQRQVAKLQSREREAMDAFRRSQSLREISQQETITGDKPGRKMKLKKESRDGNPAFLREAREHAAE